MRRKDAKGIANRIDPGQTAPLGAVWSGSALYAQIYLSENLGSLWYIKSSKGSANHEILQVVSLRSAASALIMAKKFITSHNHCHY